MFRKIFSTSIRKVTIFITSLILIGMITMGSTYALYHNETEVLTNTFSVGKVTTEIVEDFDKTGKKTPQVKNTDSIDCIVRMRYDISPSNAPLKDLVIDSKWILQSDGFYYYKGILKKDKSTTSLFSEYQIKNESNDEKEKLKQFISNYGYDFQIILYQEAVQAEMVDDAGNTIKAFDDNGNYVWSNAQKIWKCYDNNP